MNMNEKALNRWFIAALTLALLGVTLAAAGLEFTSMTGLVFIAVFGLVAAVVVIGFYFVMVAEGMRNKHGLNRTALVALFLVFPIGSAFLYYSLTRFWRNRAAL